jgi:hypothetical protein
MQPCEFCNSHTSNNRILNCSGKKYLLKQWNIYKVKLWTYMVSTPIKLSIFIVKDWKSITFESVKLQSGDDTWIRLQQCTSPVHHPELLNLPKVLDHFFFLYSNGFDILCERITFNFKVLCNLDACPLRDKIIYPVMQATPSLIRVSDHRLYEATLLNIRLIDGHVL